MHFFAARRGERKKNERKGAVISSIHFFGSRRESEGGREKGEGQGRKQASKQARKEGLLASGKLRGRPSVSENGRLQKYAAGKIGGRSINKGKCQIQERFPSFLLGPTHVRVRLFQELAPLPCMEWTLIVDVKCSRANKHESVP